MTPRTQPRRQRLSADERREQLLDVTKAIVHEHGFHAVSIEAVARAAGITRPIVYDHFDGLGDLLAATLERETARALAQLTELLPATLEEPDRGTALLGALRAYLEAVESDPVTWGLTLMPPEGTPEVLHERVRQGREVIRGMLAHVVGDGITPGRPSPDPALTASVLQALSEECARLLLTDPAAYPVDRLMDHARWLIGSLGKPI